LENVDDLTERYFNLTPEQQKKFKLVTNLTNKPDNQLPHWVSKPTPAERPKSANSKLNTHFNSLSFTERTEFIQEMASERYKRKNSLD